MAKKSNPISISALADPAHSRVIRRREGITKFEIGSLRCVTARLGAPERRDG